MFSIQKKQSIIRVRQPGRRQRLRRMWGGEGCDGELRADTQLVEPKVQHHAVDQAPGATSLLEVRTTKKHTHTPHHH